MKLRWRILAALTVARTVIGFQFQSVASVAPFLTAELGLDKAQLGWLIGLYLLPGIAIALPGGILGARFGEKRITLAGLALMGLGGLGLALASTVPGANLARAVSGVGAVILNVLLTKMVADWFDGRERVLAMSILINSWPIGIGIALLSLGPVGERWGVQWALALTAVLAAVGWVCIRFVYRAPPTAAPASAALDVGLKTIDRAEWPLLIVASLPWLLYNAAYQIMVSFLPSFFIDQGQSVAHSGFATALNTVLFMVSVQVGGFLLKRSSHPDWLCHGAIVAWAASLVLMSFGSTPLVWIVLGGLAGGIPASAYFSLPAELLRPQSRGAGMGVFFTIYYVGCAILPAVAGALYDLVGNGGAAVAMAGAIAFACVPALAAFRLGMRGKPVNAPQ
jgi:MFS family permease